MVRYWTEEEAIFTATDQREKYNNHSWQLTQSNGNLVEWDFYEVSSRVRWTNNAVNTASAASVLLLKPVHGDHQSLFFRCAFELHLSDIQCPFYGTSSPWAAKCCLSSLHFCQCQLKSSVFKSLTDPEFRECGETRQFISTSMAGGRQIAAAPALLRSACCLIYTFF